MDELLDIAKTFSQVEFDSLQSSQVAIMTHYTTSYSLVVERTTKNLTIIAVYADLSYTTHSCLLAFQKIKSENAPKSTQLLVDEVLQSLKIDRKNCRFIIFNEKIPTTFTDNHFSSENPVYVNTHFSNFLVEKAKLETRKISPAQYAGFGHYFIEVANLTSSQKFQEKLTRLKNIEKIDNVEVFNLNQISEDEKIDLEKSEMSKIDKVEISSQKIEQNEKVEKKNLIDFAESFDTSHVNCLTIALFFVENPFRFFLKTPATTGAIMKLLQIEDIRIEYENALKSGMTPIQYWRDVSGKYCIVDSYVAQFVVFKEALLALKSNEIAYQMIGEMQKNKMPLSMSKVLFALWKKDKMVQMKKSQIPIQNFNETIEEIYQKNFFYNKKRLTLSRQSSKEKTNNRPLASQTSTISNFQSPNSKRSCQQKIPLEVKLINTIPLKQQWNEESRQIFLQKMSDNVQKSQNVPISMVQQMEIEEKSDLPTQMKKTEKIELLKTTKKENFDVCENFEKFEHLNSKSPKLEIERCHDKSSSSESDTSLCSLNHSEFKSCKNVMKKNPLIRDENIFEIKKAKTEKPRKKRLDIKTRKMLIDMKAYIQSILDEDASLSDTQNE